MATPEKIEKTKVTNASLYTALCAIQSEDECRDFLADLCTPRELQSLQERWDIVCLLDRGDLSYRAVSAQVGASTTTIGRVARFLLQERHLGYRRILDRLKKTKK